MVCHIYENEGGLIAGTKSGGNRRTWCWVTRGDRQENMMWGVKRQHQEDKITGAKKLAEDGGESKLGSHHNFG